MYLIHMPIIQLLLYVSHTSSAGRFLFTIYYFIMRTTVRSEI